MPGPNSHTAVDDAAATARGATRTHTAEEIGAHFRRQQAHQWTVRRRTAAERAAKLTELKRSIVAHREEILNAMHADFRKSHTEAELTEIQLVLNELNEAVAHVAEWMTPVPVRNPMTLPGTRSRIQYEARGVVLIMAAWNYPFALVFAPLVAAIAAGNCVMVRASEKVPRTSDVARRVIEEAFDPDEVAMIGGDRSTAQILLDLPFDHVFFTGSTVVGRAIMTATARNLSGVTLELGGKSPVVIDESADVRAAARSVAWGKFVNAGQTCVAPDYVLIHASRAQEFFEASRDALSAFYGASDDARRASDDYCRMIDDASWARVTKLLDEAVRAGARIETGGQTDAAERYVAPTILSNVLPTSPIMADEIFGPILPVLTYHARDEVFAFLHARPKPLAMYVFSNDERRTDDILSGTAAGGTVINNCLIHLMNPALPFGGVGESGFGNYHGRFGFETFSHARAVLVQGRPNLTRLFHPPYARLRSGWLGALLRLGRRLRD